MKTISWIPKYQQAFLLLSVSAGLILAGCERLSGPSSNNTDSSKTASPLTILATEDQVFLPVTATVSAGQTITWNNVDTMSHTVTTDFNDPAVPGPNSDAQYPTGIPPGASYTWIVPDAPAGTVWFYHCRFHGTSGGGQQLGTGMVGAVSME